MRRRSKRVSSWLGLAFCGAVSTAAIVVWNAGGDATAQERDAPGALAQAAPRDVTRQPLAGGAGGGADAVRIPLSEGGPSVEDLSEDALVEGAPVDGVPLDGGPRSLEIASVIDPAPASGGSPMETVTVLVDHAKVVRLPETTQTVIVGNPIVADITVQRNGILIVTGKSYGATNLIALDSAGMLLAESMISVQAPSDSVVLVQRGLARESYSCTPTCQPSLRLGDSPEYFGGVGNQATQRNTLATQR